MMEFFNDFFNSLFVNLVVSLMKNTNKQTLNVLSDYISDEFWCNFLFFMRKSRQKLFLVQVQLVL